jgi:hypothetical protein
MPAALLLVVPSSKRLYPRYRKSKQAADRSKHRINIVRVYDNNNKCLSSYCALWASMMSKNADTVVGEAAQTFKHRLDTG